MDGFVVPPYFQRDVTRVLACVNRTSPKHGCIVVGSVKRGKSQMLRAVHQSLQASPNHDVIYHKLTESEINLSGSKQFFKSLAKSVRKTLRHRYRKATRAVRKTTESKHLFSAKDATDYAHLLTALVQHSAKDLVYIVDNPQSIPPNLIVDLLGALHQVLEQTRTASACARFFVILSATIDLQDIAKPQMRTFRELLDRVELGDLTRQEAVALVESYAEKVGLALESEGLKTLFTQTAHDYYLITQIMETCCALFNDTACERRLTPQLVNRAIDIYVQTFNPTDVLARYFQRSAKLLDIAVRFVTDGSQKGLSLQQADIHFSPLLYGLFKNESGTLYIKCPLWERLLRAHLTPLEIGRYYVLHRDWHAALEYMGRAYREALRASDAQTDLIYQELRATILKAMYASKTPKAEQYVEHGPIVRSKEAINYFLHGLAMLYPNSQPCLYAENVEEFYPKDAADKHITSEIYERAVHKAEYSLMRFNASGYNTLLIPMHLGEGERVYQGLLTLRVPSSEHGHVYKQWKQHEALVALAKEAATAIATKQQEIEALVRSLKFANKTKVMFETAGEMLHQKTLTEDLLLKLACHAMSAGVGLGFNRVVFLMRERSPQGEVLRVTHAIGHLNYDDAQKDWEAVRDKFKDLKALRKDVLEQNGLNWVKTPLARALEGYELPIKPKTTHVLGALEKDIIKTFNSAQYLWQNPSRTSKTRRQNPESALTIALRLRPEYLILPLIASEDRPLGVVYADYALNEKPIPSEIITLADTFVRQVALAIENLRRFTNKEAENSTLNTLLTAVQNTTQDRRSRNVQELVQAIVDEVQRWLNADSVVVYSVGSRLLDEPNFVKVAPSHVQVIEADKLQDRGTIRRMVRQFNPLRIDNLDNQPAFLSDAEYEAVRSSDFIEDNRIKCFVGLPLGEQDEDLGVLYVNWRAPYQLNDSTISLLKVYSAFASEAIRRAHYTQQNAARIHEMLEVLGNPPSDQEAELEKLRESAHAGLERLAAQLQAPSLKLYLTEPNNQWRVFTYPESDIDNTTLQEELPDLVWQAFRTGGSSPHRAAYQISKPLEFEGNCVAVVHLGWHDDHVIERLANKADISEDFLSFRQNLGRLDAARLYEAQRAILKQPLPKDVFSDDKAMYKMLQELTEIMMHPGRMVDAISLYVIEQDDVLLGGLVGFLNENKHRMTWRESETFIRSLIADSADIITHDEETTLLLDNDVAEREGFTACAVVPLKVNDRGVGCVFFNCRFPHQFSESEKQQMIVLGAFAAAAIHQATLARMIKKLSEFAHQINASLKSDEVFKTLLEQARDITGAEHVAVVEQSGSHELTIAAVNFQEYALNKPFYRVNGPLRSDGAYVVCIPEVNASGQPQDISTASLAGWAIKNRKTAYIPDVLTEKTLPYFPTNPQTRANLAIPIIRKHECSAALVLESTRPNAFSEQAIDLVSQLASHAGIAISNARQQEQMMHTLLHDLQLDAQTLTDTLKSIDNTGNHTSLKPLVSKALRTVFDIDDTLNLISMMRHQGRIEILNPIYVSDFLIALQDYTQYHQPPNTAWIKDYRHPENARFMGNRTYLKHVMANIIRNAYDAIKDRHGEPSSPGQLRVRTRVRGEWLYIYIQDNGCGIERRENGFDYIFAPGYTTREAKRHSSGQGLTDCKAILTAHGGKVRVFSRVNQGTIFSIMLPIKFER